MWQSRRQGEGQQEERWLSSGRWSCSGIEPETDQIKQLVTYPGAEISLWLDLIDMNSDLLYLQADLWLYLDPSQTKLSIHTNDKSKYQRTHVWKSRNHVRNVKAH